MSWQAIRQSLAYWLAPSALIAIALLQFVESHWGGLTAWKGGGFGMFSTADSPDGRFLRAYLITPGEEIPVQIPSKLSRDELLVRTWPSSTQLLGMARDMSQLKWFRGPTSWAGLQAQEDRARFSQLNMPSDRPRMIYSTDKTAPPSDRFQRLIPRAIRIEVWHVRLEQHGQVLAAQRWMSESHELPASEGP